MSTTVQSDQAEGGGSVGGPVLKAKSTWISGVEVDDDLIDAAAAQLLAAGGPARLTGTGGFLPGLVKAVLERGLQAELSEHLGYDKGDPGRGRVG